LSETWDVIIAGAGPAGLMAAARLAGLRVLVLEKNRAAARKLLLTGGGHCNLTHLGAPRELLARYGGHGEFLRPALRALSNRGLQAFFAGRGVACRAEPDGRVLPASGRAADVRAALLRALREAGGELRPSAAIRAVQALPGGGFEVELPGGSPRTRALVLATGGLAYPRTGSTGDGWTWARALGHRVVPPRPALAPISLEDADLRALSGLALTRASLSLWRGDRRLQRSAGEVLLTHQGLSGPAALDLSRWVRPGDRLTLDLLSPESGNRERARARVLEGFERAGARGVRGVVRALTPTERLAELVLDRAGLQGERKAAGVGRAERHRLADLLCDLPLAVRGVGGFEVAMATAGGVSLDEVAPESLASRLLPGLFFAGEILDVDGDCGGYNLQAAFSTGHLAAEGVRAHLEVRRS
jgi:predicted Rossmann fold flavoprotein